MEFFETNLSALDNHNPPLAKRLRNIQELKHSEVFMNEGEIASLNIVNTTNFTPLYEGTPTKSVDESLFSFANFDNYPYLYMYGLGNGVLIKKLLSNHKHKRVVVVEPDDEIIFIVLHLVDFSAEISQKRLALFSQEEINFPNALALFGDIGVQRYARVYDLHVNTNYYLKCYETALKKTNQIFLEALYHGINSAGNDPTDSLIGLKHHLINLPKVIKTPPTFELFKKLGTTKTAVLVSTGPSLNKQLPLLKKIAPYVRIIAVDASFPLLYKAGIKPDVVVSIERVVESAKFFTQTPKEAFKDVIFALTSLQHKEVIESIKDGTTQISLRPLGYMMLTGPDEWGYLGLGMSAANMAYELIYHSKFQTCILIGQDLAYGEDGATHADGHVFGKSDSKEKGDIWVSKWGNKGRVRTNHTWDMFRKFFEKDIAETKSKMLTINATEGGASIFGALEIPFDQAIALHVNQDSIKAPLHLNYVSQKDLKPISKKIDTKIDEIASYIQNLLYETKELFLNVAKACENKDASIDELEQLLAQIDKKIKGRFEEPIFKNVAWHIAQSMMLSQEIALAPIEVKKAKKSEKTRALIEAYKPWLFSFAGILDAILKTIFYAKARQLIDKVKTVDVYLGNKKIDSFTCKELRPKLGHVFDVDMRGLLYDAPDKYQEEIEKIVFKDAKTDKLLPQTFVSTIRRNDEKFNEFSFINSLKNPINEAEIIDLYSPNVIGFLATKENLQDQKFVKYIKEIMHDFSSVKFKALVFNGNLNNDIKDKFECTNLELMETASIHDIYKNLEVYLSNNDRNKLDTQVLMHLRAQSTNVFCMGLYLNRLSTSIIEHEKADPAYYGKFFDNLELLGFSKEDIKRYGNTFHEIYFKKAAQKYGVDIGFNLNESISKAYIYWNLKLGLANHEFFKDALLFSKKFAKLQL
jgi:hypothetical protein